jgi:hypothetical protein
MDSADLRVAMKVTSDHLRRNAYLYVRQSTLKQVIHNTESTLRQYDLRGRAIGLGWVAEQIVVIDTDQGQSGASAADRDGFQRLVAEVSMGRPGSCSAWRCPGWHVTTPTGTGCWRSAHCPAR